MLEEIKISLDTITQLEKLWRQECPYDKFDTMPLASGFIRWLNGKKIEIEVKRIDICNHIFILKSHTQQNITALLLRC